MNWQTGQTRPLSKNNTLLPSNVPG